LLEDCLTNELLDLRSKAAQAIGPLFEKYIVLESTETCDIINMYMNKLLSNNMMERIGYSLVLGSLPPSFIHKNIQQILKSLIGCTQITRLTIKWAESRRDAVIAITKIWSKLIKTPCMLYISNYYIIFLTLIFKFFILGYVEKCVEHSNIILCCLINCALEYTMDHRGDVGVWVREAAINGLEVCITIK
jgi:hypothetical protein